MIPPVPNWLSRTPAAVKRATANADALYPPTTIAPLFWMPIPVISEPLRPSPAVRPLLPKEVSSVPGVPTMVSWNVVVALTTEVAPLIVMVSGLVVGTAVESAVNVRMPEVVPDSIVRSFGVTPPGKPVTVMTTGSVGSPLRVRFTSTARAAASVETVSGASSFSVSPPGLIGPESTSIVFPPSASSPASVGAEAAPEELEEQAENARVTMSVEEASKAGRRSDFTRGSIHLPSRNERRRNQPRIAQPRVDQLPGSAPAFFLGSGKSPPLR